MTGAPGGQREGEAAEQQIVNRTTIETGITNVNIVGNR
jgi:hypothetical protein